MQSSFSELMRLLVLIALTFAATVFGSWWVLALFGAVAWTIFTTVREKLRAA